LTELSIAGNEDRDLRKDNAGIEGRHGKRIKRSLDEMEGAQKLKKFWNVKKIPDGERKIKKHKGEEKDKEKKKKKKDKKKKKERDKEKKNAEEEQKKMQNSKKDALAPFF
jgi:hypothetical protein